MTNEPYYVVRGKQRYGPFTAQKLKQLAQAHELRADDVIVQGVKRSLAGKIAGLVNSENGQQDSVPARTSFGNPLMKSGQGHTLFLNATAQEKTLELACDCGALFQVTQKFAGTRQVCRQCKCDLEIPPIEAIVKSIVKSVDHNETFGFQTFFYPNLRAEVVERARKRFATFTDPDETPIALVSLGFLAYEGILGLKPFAGFGVGRTGILATTHGVYCSWRSNETRKPQCFPLNTIYSVTVSPAKSNKYRYEIRVNDFPVYDTAYPVHARTFVSVLEGLAALNDYSDQSSARPPTRERVIFSCNAHIGRRGRSSIADERAMLIFTNRSFFIIYRDSNLIRRRANKSILGYMLKSGAEAIETALLAGNDIDEIRRTATASGVVSAIDEVTQVSRTKSIVTITLGERTAFDCDCGMSGEAQLLEAKIQTAFPHLKPKE
jgi:hypothetical protein